MSANWLIFTAIVLTFLAVITFIDKKYGKRGEL